MKVRFEGKLLYITEALQEEISWLDKMLTWKDDQSGEVDKLLFKNEEGKYYSFWGLYTLLTKYCECPYPVILENPQEFTSDKFDLKDDILEGITLMDFQIAAVKKSLLFKKGILSCPTGSGKTEIILAVLRYLLDNKLINSCVIVVPSVGLAEQLLERALRRGFNSTEISAVHSKSAYQETPIVVGVVNSLNIAMNKNDKLGKFIHDTDCLIFDEAHHSRATTFLRIILDTNPKYLLLYSGSPFSQKNIIETSGDTLLFMVAGNIIFTISQRYLIGIGLIAEPIIHYKALGGRIYRNPGRYNVVYDTHIVNNKIRNEAIVNYTNKFVNLGFSSLILVQRLEHAKTLMEMMKHQKIICVFGGGQGLQINEVGQVEECPVDYNMFRNNFEAGVWDIIIGSQVIDEGFDLPTISSVVLAGSGKGRIKLLQRVGRGLRRKKIGKNQVYIIDFQDKQHMYLSSQYRKRRILMEEIEATIIDDEVKFFSTVIEHSRELKELNKDSL